MANPDLRLIDQRYSYYADSEGDIWKIMKGRPRKQNTNTICHRKFNGKWFRLLKASPKGKNKNYLGIHLKVDLPDTVHRLVLIAFNKVSNYKNLQVNHINRNTFDNRPSNLEWCTNKENKLHSTVTELTKSYSELEADWKARFSKKYSNRDNFIADNSSYKIKYDIDAIKWHLENRELTLKEISTKLGCSLKSVRYWKEKCKYKKRLTIKDKIVLLLKEDSSLSAKELATKTDVRITSIHGVLRKMSKE